MSTNRLRWAIFSSSVVSAVNNPDAHLLRALGRHLVEQGDEVQFFEERGNEPVRALLRQSGARAIRAFGEVFPEIDYRTIDRQTGFILIEWLTRTVATYDIALVQRDTPMELALWLGRLTRRHLQTYLLDTGISAESVTDAMLLAREPANYSGIFVDSEERAGVYHPLVRPERIHRFGPLPEQDRLIEQMPDGGERATDQLREVVRDLAETVARTAERDRAAWLQTSTITPNGRDGGQAQTR